MYKTELVRKIAKDTRLSQRIVRDIVNANHKLITETLREGETVTFPGFGTFYTRTRQAGRIRDIKTGKDLVLPSMQVAAFRVGEVLKQAVRKKPRRRNRLSKVLNWKKE